MNPSADIKKNEKKVNIHASQMSAMCLCGFNIPFFP